MHAWKHARSNDDFSEFAPALRKIVDMLRRKAECYGWAEGGEPWDALAEDYDSLAKAFQDTGFVGSPINWRAKDGDAWQDYHPSGEPLPAVMAAEVERRRAARLLRRAPLRAPRRLNSHGRCSWRYGARHLSLFYQSVSTCLSADSSMQHRECRSFAGLRPAHGLGSMQKFSDFGRRVVCRDVPIAMPQ